MAGKGSYILILHIGGRLKTPVGALGIIDLSEGHYIYVGSGYSGIEKRISRYYSLNSGRRSPYRKRWHIDYIVSRKETAVCASIAFLNRRIECEISSLLDGNGLEPIRGFGSSDCRCVSHLYRAGDPVSLTEAIDTLFKLYCVGEGGCVVI